MHKLLENYLIEVSQRLGSLPAKRRDDELREMRQHLENAMAVNCESGQTEDEAAANALMQFGTVEEASASVVRAWRQGTWKKSIWLFLKTAGLFTAAYLTLALQYPSHIHMWFCDWASSILWFALLTTLIIGLPYLPSKYQPEWLQSRWLVNVWSD